jgi:hypothetical protein
MQMKCVVCEVGSKCVLFRRTCGSVVWHLWWTKCHWYRLSSQYFSFPLSVSSHQCSVLIFILMPLLSEGQAGKAWELSDEAGLFRMSGSARIHECVLERVYAGVAPLGAETECKWE